MDAENSRQRRGKGPDNVFLVINVFHRGPVRVSLEKRLDHGVKSLLQGDPYHFFKEAYNLV